jgi:DnaJ-domain-containing protein 1
MLTRTRCCKSEQSWTKVVRDTQAQHEDVIAVAADLARDLAAQLEPQDRALLLQLMYSVAWVDRVLHPGEEALIAACEEALEIPQELAGVLRCLWVTGTFGDEQDVERSRNEAFSVLDLPSRTPMAEIKKRYRELARRYHPDKVIQMGEEFAEIATVKFKEVQAAYAVITSEPASLQRHALCPECHELSQLRSPAGSVACSHCASAVAESTNAAWVVNCHFCGAKNRVPHSRGGATPRCGK